MSITVDRHGGFEVEYQAFIMLHVYIIFMYHEMVQQDTSQSVSDIHNYYDAFDTILPVIPPSSIQAWCIVHGA